METVVLERSFVTPPSPADLEHLEKRFPWCLEKYQVAPICSYVALDGLSAVCLYRAPDAEVVRQTQRTATMPVERVWTADRVVGEREVGPAGHSLVVMLRESPVPVDREYVRGMYARGEGCFAIHRVEPLSSYLARDGLRLLCVFSAPDAEAVRLANRQLGLPFSRAFPARHMSVTPA